MEEPVELKLKPGQRYRCKQCANLTRFDVTKTTQTREFHHFTLGGECEVEERDILTETVEEVKCRWCDSGKGIEIIEGPDTV